MTNKLKWAVVTTGSRWHKDHAEMISTVNNILQLFDDEDTAMDACGIYSEFYADEVRVVPSSMRPGDFI